MADAIIGPPVASADGALVALDAAPLAVQTWEGRSVRLGEVIAALPDLRHQASARGAGTRTAVMTIVMVIGPDDDPEAIAAPVRALGAHHPCRAVVLRPDPDSTPVIDAKAFLWRADPTASEGHPVFFEEVHLHVGGQAASHLASIVGPFVLADLPVVMWFPDVLPDPADPLLRLASALVVDTRVVAPDPAAMGHSYRTLLELANHQPVVDLSWVRLQPWRELLAGLFEPEHSRPFVQCVCSASVSGKPGPVLHTRRLADVPARPARLASSCSPTRSTWTSPWTLSVRERKAHSRSNGTTAAGQFGPRRRCPTASPTARPCRCPTTR